MVRLLWGTWMVVAAATATVRRRDPLNRGVGLDRYGAVKVTTAELANVSMGVLIRLPSQGMSSLLHAVK
jgi:hypothetical protein